MCGCMCTCVSSQLFDSFPMYPRVWKLKIEVGFCCRYLFPVSLKTVSLEYLIHLTFSKKEFLWGSGSNDWVSSITLEPQVRCYSEKEGNTLPPWARSTCCEKDTIQSAAVILCRYCRPLRSNLLVTTLVEGNSGRETPEPSAEPPVPNGKERAGCDLSDRCPLPSWISRKLEGTRSEQGAGQAGTGPRWCAYHEHPTKRIMYAAERCFTEMHLPSLTLENPTNLWLTQMKEAITEHPGKDLLNFDEGKWPRFRVYFFFSYLLLAMNFATKLWFILGAFTLAFCFLIE